MTVGREKNFKKPRLKTIAKAQFRKAVKQHPASNHRDPRWQFLLHANFASQAVKESA